MAVWCLRGNTLLIDIYVVRIDDVRFSAKQVINNRKAIFLLFFVLFWFIARNEWSSNYLLWVLFKDKTLLSFILQMPKFFFFSFFFLFVVIEFWLLVPSNKGNALCVYSIDFSFGRINVTINFRDNTEYTEIKYNFVILGTTFQRTTKKKKKILVSILAITDTFHIIDLFSSKPFKNFSLKNAHVTLKAASVSNPYHRKLG